LSLCWRKSRGKLWCGPCHDPHQQPSDSKTYFRDRCLACHGVTLLKTHTKPSEDCIGCHMPIREVTDGAHTTFTDHRIARKALPENVAEVPVEERKLVAWHDPPAELAARELGLADVEVGEKLRSKTMILAGMQLLLSCWSKSPNDVAVLTDIGEVLFNVGDCEHSATVYEQALKLEPDVATHYLHAAVAWRAALDKTKAADYLEKALQRDPLLGEAYRQLGEIYSELGDTDMARRTRARYLRAFRGNVAAPLDVPK
jgi:predicted Zn-dependent protease